MICLRRNARALLAFACLAGDARASSVFGNNPEHGDGQVNNGFDQSSGAPGDRRGPPPGPWTTRAGDELKTSSSLISAQELSAANAAATAARNVQCNGATCSTAASVAHLAQSSATRVVSTASSRLLQADELRKEMLKELGSGRYSAEEVKRVRNLLRESPAPTEREISALPEKVRDLARGLGTNYREMALLDEKRAQYGRVAAGAREMSQKLKGNEARAETLRPAAAGPAGIGLTGRELAAYPSKKSGKTFSASRDSAITGGTDAFLPLGALGKKIAPPKSPFDVADETSLPKPAEEKTLTGEGASLIAGMISELDYDMSQKLGDTAVGAGVLPPDVAVNSMPEGVEAGTLVGDALLVQAGAEADPHSSARGPAGRTLASVSLPGNLDYLGTDKDLFRRVNDQMRRRAKALKP